MTKLNSAILLAATIVIIGCRKDPNNTESKSTSRISTISIDGWEITKSNLDFHINPRGIHFVNSDIGFVVGYNGDIYKTSDSGITWQKQNSGTTLHLHSVFFLNENIGFAGGQVMNCDKGCVFLKTTNGGATWTKIFFPDYTYIRSIKFFDDLKGIALISTPWLPNSRSEFIARTSNGGLSWEIIDLPIKPAYDKFLRVLHYKKERLITNRV
jgi:photosystem II stability/assembly factor-like uncharacterized protein